MLLTWRQWVLPAVVVFVLSVAAPPEARADVKLAGLFSDHAVLQADAEVPVWGTASPGVEVHVAVAGKTATCTADEDGEWQTTVGPLKAGGPHRLAVESGEGDRLIRSDVMVGEVWLASGQSNMVWPVRRTKTGEEAIKKGDRPGIRFFKVANVPGGSPRKDVPGGPWMRSTPDTVPGFSAAAYYFARTLREELNVPVGIIQSAVGGSRVQAWIRRGAFAGNSALEPDLKQIEELEKKLDSLADVERPRKTPTVYYNAMIAPLVPYAFRGAIWYQGEANAKPGDAERYEAAFSTLIREWRREWGHEFPFLFVQLPEFRGRGEHWVRLREEQRLTSEHVDNTAMIVTLGLGNPQNIHPRRKRPVGHRLALAALAKAYGRTDASWSGPQVKHAEALGDGRVKVSFRHAHGGLKTRNGALTGFEVQGGDGEWSGAEARISGEAIVVHSADVSEPRAVRYAWSEVPDVSLYNEAGLPASPFNISIAR